MSKLRTAIVGTGGIAGAHVRADQLNADRVDLVAAVDIDPARLDAFADEHGIPERFTDLATMLAAVKPDIVHICTPPGLHCGQIETVLDAGAWVFCEKPLCASLAEFDRITAAEARSGNYCSSVFQWRYGDGGQHLKRLIADNALGRPLLANVLTVWYRDAAYYAVPWRGKWATELGGVTMGHGIHAMDFLLWLYGDWREVRAMMGTLDHDIEVEDVSLAQVRFANGAMANITNSVVSPRQESYVRFDFEKATVEVTHLYRYKNEDWRFTGIDTVPADEVAAWAELPADVVDFHSAQFAAFLDAYDAGERPPVSGADVRPTLEFLAALYKSAITGQPVLRGSIGPDDPYYTAMCGPCE